ncbi:cytochrome b N-terminal domain-containing protein [Bartonella sp. HY329]|uniref:cytochrome b n=1 Tax=unclassified Bartonella TaxID=2645622 RepID=UPI0021C95D0B|nr:MULTISPECIES: cytochrome b N-terminal domain-containing protein [unclassified Bartonella]UXM94580.1 cytochrome b N-terminal domain-containing protein [Bartonella sp. HY329]UXN08904.1 cytochrome b N-terminal domain-containing protein [Bartonella sp. HY328]
MKKSSYTPKTKLGCFLDERLPIMRMMHDLAVSFPVPRNLNYFYTFGGILSLMLVSQILTGIVMAMHYVPDVAIAFESRERFMRDGQFGWLFGPWHGVGASFFFIAAYIHLARGLYYGSHKRPREIVWILGVLIYFVMMATAFLGYVLVWGQMSVSAASVITNFFKAIPFIGDWLYETILGGYSLGQPTLNRFYALHYLFPFILLLLVGLHVWAIHVVGQNNPTGVEVQKPDETVPFTPFAMIKDIFAISVFLIFFAWFLFYMPDYLGHPDNFIEADPLKSSPHIQPEWYFLPFYAMLRAITFDFGPINSTLGGVLVLFGSVGVLIFVPWLDRSKIRSCRYRPLFKLFFWLFIADVIMLGWLGTRSVEDVYILWAQIGTAYYFVFFLVIMPFLPRFEKTLPLPASITADLAARKERGKSLW